MKKRGHWFYLLLLGLLALLCSCGANTSAQNTAGTSGDSVTVNIKTGDFFITSPVTSFTTGVKYHFVVTNTGTHHHDFLIMHPEDTKLLTMDQVYQRSLGYIYNIAPNETKTLDFTFDHTAPAGMLEFSCHYGGHYETGMHQPITVKAASGATVTNYPNNGIPTTALNDSQATGPCDKAVKVTIGDNGAVTPASVDIKSGDTLTFVNTTDKAYTLTSTPDAGIRFTVVDEQETEFVPFSKAGTFTITSQEQSALSLKVTVADTKGYTCGTQSVATVSFDANYSNPQADQYFFTPASVKIQEGQSITLSNLSDADLTFSSKPDAQLGHIVIDKNEHQLLFFADSGTYVISCDQYPHETFTIVVEEMDND